MRVTDKMGFNQVTANLQKNRGEMNELQNQAATQKRINKPSDDPVAASRVIGARAEVKMNQQFLKNIDIARSFLEASDVSLSELTENLMRAKELAVQASNDPGGGADSRRITSLEVEQIFNESIQIGNRKLGERYIFGGNRTNRPPLDPGGAYHGDDGEMKIQVNKDTYVGMNVTGDQVFIGHNYSDSNNLVPPAGVPKNLKELAEYKEEETERLANKKEIEDHEVQVEARSPASVSRNTEVIHPGEAGTDYKSTGINILGALKDLQVGLKVNDKESVQEAIDNIDQAIGQVVQARANLGARISVLNSTADSLRKQGLENKQTISELEDVDLFQTVSDMQKSDSTLKATLETSGKVIQHSLLDFLK